MCLHESDALFALTSGPYRCAPKNQSILPLAMHSSLSLTLCNLAVICAGVCSAGLVVDHDDPRQQMQ